MNIWQLISLLFLLNSEVLVSGDYAYPLENGFRQMGVFQPQTYGMKNNIELSIHPILFLIKPNVQLKKFHREINGFGLASRYSFNYPTPILKYIKRDGIGGFLADDPDISEIPSLFVFQSELLVTKKLSNYSLTGKLGMSICPGCDLDSRHLIDYDLVYHRMAIYHYGIGANFGLDWDYVYLEKLLLKADMDIFFLPQEKMFLEHKLLLSYDLNKKYTLTMGYKYSYGYYRFNEGKGLWNLFPLMDLSWRWRK